MRDEFRYRYIDDINGEIVEGFMQSGEKIILNAVPSKSNLYVLL